MNRRSFLSSSALAQLAFGQQAPQPSGYRLGSVTYNLLKDMNLESLILTIESTGFTAVELRTGHKHGVEPSIDATERTRVRERFARSKVRLLSYGSTCEFQSPDPAERLRQGVIARSFVDLAKDTGALAVKVRPNGFPEGIDHGTTIRNIGGALRELGDYGQSKGIEIWMEVHGRGTQEPENAAAILKTASHQNVGACWNSNPTDVKNGSVRESFRLLRPYLRNAHINELYSSYPWREFFRLLRESEYDRYTLAEVEQSKEPERFMKYYRALWLALVDSN